MNDQAALSNLTPEAVGCAQQILDVVVLHTSFDRVLNASNVAVLRMLDIRMPAGILFMADPGMGKTLLLTLLKKQLASRGSSMLEPRPILHIELDSIVDSHKVAAKLMLCLGYPMVPTRSSLENMLTMVDKAMDRLHPLALLIDEGQHICEGNRDITARAVTDLLKVRMDKHNMPVILAGTRKLERIAEINPQFSSRASAEYFIDAIEPGPEWQQLVMSFISSVKLVDLSVLSTAGLSRRLHQASKGNLRRLKKLLVSSCLELIRCQQHRMTEQYLEIGFADAFGESTAVPNPFFQRKGPGGLSQSVAEQQVA